MKPVLNIENLSTGYPSRKNGNVVLQRAMHASLKAGELICVLGPNGAGKSTLLRTLAGFQKPLAGRVRLNGKPLQDFDLKALARQIAVVLTDRFSDLYLTAFDVVRMGRFPYASFFGKMQNADVALIRQTMENLGVAALQDKLFYNLSDGERQKVLIARALVQDTPFLLLDEPVAFIDSPGRIDIMELLRSLAHEKGKAVFMTTHDMETALHYADFLWLLHRRKPLVSGIPEDMALRGKVGEYFDHPGLQFDVAQGRFVSRVLKNRKQEMVSVGGKGAEITWLKRALAREGFSVKSVPDTPGAGFWAGFEKNAFVLYRHGEKMGTFENIADVLRVLNKAL